MEVKECFKIENLIVEQKKKDRESNYVSQSKNRMEPTENNIASLFSCFYN